MIRIILLFVLILGGCASRPPQAVQPSTRWTQTDEPFRSFTTYQYRNYPGRIIDGAVDMAAREYARQLNERILEKIR